MQLRQIRYVLEVHRCGNNISAAAELLHTSQPAISKQIQLLEYELGFNIFERTRNRVVGLTDPGQEVLKIAQRIFSEIENLRSIRDDFDNMQQGRLVIATTHTHARYILPKVIHAFLKRYPKVQIGLLQGNPTEICEMIESGAADLAVGTDAMRSFPALAMLPCFEIKRSVIAPKDHPILTVEPLTLEEIAKYPVIAHDAFRSGQWKILDAFVRRGIELNIPFTAVDADIGKTYVELGLGIAILATVAVDPTHDGDLRARDASHLFESSTTLVRFRKSAYLRRFIFDFIQILAPNLTKKMIEAHQRS